MRIKTGVNTSRTQSSEMFATVLLGKQIIFIFLFVRVHFARNSHRFRNIHTI